MMSIALGSQCENPPTRIKTLTLIGRLTCHSSASPNSSVSLVSICLAIILLVNIVVAPPDQEEIGLAGWLSGKYSAEDASYHKGKLNPK